MSDRLVEVLVTVETREKIKKLKQKLTYDKYINQILKETGSSRRGPNEV